MASATIRQLLHPTSANYDIQKFSSSPVVPCSLVFTSNYSSRFPRAVEFSGHRSRPSITRAFPGKGGGSAAVEDEDDGVSLGTMKLPLDTDLPRFETLLFQWANSLCQGANLPLPVPLKVDKIPGGARLGFVTIGDEDQTEVLVYIDCVVFPAADGSGPLFRAIRNGPSKDQTPPGEPRIMRSLLQAIKKSAEIARV